MCPLDPVLTSCFGLVAPQSCLSRVSPGSHCSQIVFSKPVVSHHGSGAGALENVSPLSRPRQVLWGAVPGCVNLKPNSKKMSAAYDAGGADAQTTSNWPLVPKSLLWATPATLDNSQSAFENTRVCLNAYFLGHPKSVFRPYLPKAILSGHPGG